MSIGKNIGSAINRETSNHKGLNGMQTESRCHITKSTTQCFENDLEEAFRSSCFLANHDRVGQSQAEQCERKNIQLTIQAFPTDSPSLSIVHFMLQSVYVV